MIILLVIATFAVTAPIAGALLVGHGSRREDRAFSLSHQPGGLLQAATRRLLNFHGDGIGPRPASRGGAGARPGAAPGGWDDGIALDDEFGGGGFAGHEFGGDVAGHDAGAPLAGSR
jgi:hypothetical protein